MQEECGLDPREHVIVDRDSWENARTMMMRQMENVSVTGLKTGMHFIYQHRPEDEYNHFDHTNVHMHIEQVGSLPNILDQFKNFLQANGFSFNDNTTLEVVKHGENEEDDEQRTN